MIIPALVVSLFEECVYACTCGYAFVSLASLSRVCVCVCVFSSVCAYDIVLLVVS